MTLLKNKRQYITLLIVTLNLSKAASGRKRQRPHDHNNRRRDSRIRGLVDEWGINSDADSNEVKQFTLLKHGMGGMGMGAGGMGGGMNIMGSGGMGGGMKMGSVPTIGIPIGPPGPPSGMRKSKKSASTLAPFAVIPPTQAPSMAPTTPFPTTPLPTYYSYYYYGSPPVSGAPISPTEFPTASPVIMPVTDLPTDSPTETPTDFPTFLPTEAPVIEPTDFPTSTPVIEPTDPPTATPPTESPTPITTSSPVSFAPASPDVTASPTTTFGYCSVCGDGKEVGDWFAIFSFPGQPSVQCGLLQMLGHQGDVITLAQCAQLPYAISETCACQWIPEDAVVGRTAASRTQSKVYIHHVSNRNNSWGGSK